MNGETTRADRVEIYPDRDGRLPKLVGSKTGGWLLHVVQPEGPQLVLAPDSSAIVSAPLSEVATSGNPHPPYGLTSVARRGLRLTIGTQRCIVLFTGEVSDLEGPHADLLTARLQGDLDPFAIAGLAKALWSNRHAGSRGREAANAWKTLLAPAAAARGRLQYPPEFVKHAVTLAATSDRSTSAVAKEVGVSPATLRRWIQRFPAS